MTNGKVMTRLEQFESETALLPGLIAELAAEKRRLKDVGKFIAYAEETTLRLFEADPQFRRQMLAMDSVSWLSMWVEHWLDAWIVRGEKSLEEKRAEIRGREDEYRYARHSNIKR